MRRPWVGTVLGLSSAVICLLLLASVALGVVAMISPAQARALAAVPVLGEAAVAVALSLPAGLEIGMFAWMAAVTWGTFKGGAVGSASVGLGAVWDLLSVVMAAAAFVGDVEELAPLKEVVSAPALGVIVGIAALRLAGIVLAFRSPFYPRTR